MLIYSDRPVPADPRASLYALMDALHSQMHQTTVPHDDLVAALIDLGVLESAIADALCPDADAPEDTLRTLRTATEALGAAVAASHGSASDPGYWLERAERTLARLDANRLPRRVELRTPEGYAYYALYPEAYVDATLDWARTRRCERAVCLGLRSIGTSLSAVVHGALTMAAVPCTSWTVRPRGHPFDRHIVSTPDLVRDWLPDATVLIVDEGPGLSGSSLTGAAEWVEARGVPRERIVIIAAWDPDPASFRSPRARSHWSRYTRVSASFARVRVGVLEAIGAGAGALDLSAGGWRGRVLGERPWPAVQPQHERTKFLSNGRMARFAGLGRYGAVITDRAAMLADAGWSAMPSRLSRGFLSLTFARGTPMRTGEADPAFLRVAARYLAWLARHARSGEMARPAPLADMLRHNAREVFGDRASAAVARLTATARHFEEPAVRIDGRLLPHEWLRTASGFLKTDALDHHCGHFLPGAADTAWDVAGLMVEFDLAAAACDQLLDEYALHAGDPSIRQRLPFYRAAYAAFRLGYCTMAADAVDAAERRRFQVARQQYAIALRQALPFQ